MRSVPGAVATGSNPYSHVERHRHSTGLSHYVSLGSTDRFHNRYKTPHIPANSAWCDYNERILKAAPVVLNTQQRNSVEVAIRETCKYRGWAIYAVNVRTNHAHAVVAAGGINGDRILSALKANATRQMKQDGYWSLTTSPWTRKVASDISGTNGAWRGQLSM